MTEHLAIVLIGAPIITLGLWFWSTSRFERQIRRDRQEWEKVPVPKRADWMADEIPESFRQADKEVANGKTTPLFDTSGNLNQIPRQDK